MKVGHLVRRAPRGHLGFSWGRTIILDGRAVSYRMFLRDSTGRLFCLERAFPASCGRSFIARGLRGMQAQLRWSVDQVEFARLGLVDPSPAPGHPTGGR